MPISLLSTDYVIDFSTPEGQLLYRFGMKLLSFPALWYLENPSSGEKLIHAKERFVPGGTHVDVNFLSRLHSNQEVFLEIRREF